MQRKTNRQIRYSMWSEVIKDLLIASLMVSLLITSFKFYSTADKVEKVASRIEEYLTEERIDKYDQLTQAQLEGFRDGSKAITELLNTTQGTVRNHIDPGIDTITEQIKLLRKDFSDFIGPLNSNINNKLFPEIITSVTTLRDQTRINGEAITKFIEGNTLLIAHTDEQLLITIEMLRNRLQLTYDRLTLFFDDNIPKIETIISNANLTTGNVAGLSGNLNLISVDFQKIVNYFAGKILPDANQSQSAIAKLGRFLTGVVRFVSGLGYVIYLINAGK